MFLESVSSLGLLSPDDKSNILGAFSLSVKRTVAQQIVGFLLEVPVISGKSTITNVLPTEEHIKWAMEAIGQTFALPINPEDEPIIASAIELYRRWLLEPDHKPKVLKDDTKQFFFQTILKHCSLLFQVRKLDRETCERHARLCSKVLTLYLAVAREQQKSITTESWEVWLKLLVGIAEGMFRAQPGEELLGQLLATQTLKTLFEIWLLSHTRNAALWQTLKDLMKNWTHLMASVVQWNATTAELTNRVVGLLYGPSEGAATVSSKMEDAHPLDLQSDFVFFAWHRILHIIGNPNTLNDPKIFLEAIRGIQSLINIYLSIGRSSKKCSPPSGNTILHIFGAWLFEAIKLGRQGFDEGTALAVEAICNIFHSRKTTKYETLYYASYYSCLSDVLLREGRILVSCLLSCKHFFLYELEGSRVLIPYFIYAISNILSKKLPKEIQMKQESTLQTDSKETAKSKPLPEITTYSALKAHLTLLLLKGLKTETNPQNTEMLLWLLLTHLYETIDDNSDFAHLMIDTILSKIKSMALWPYKVTLTAFKVLSTMTQFYNKIPNNNEEASSVVMTLAKFIVAITTESQSEDNDKLIVGAYQCMLDWLISDQWIVKDSQCVSQVLNSIVLGLAPPKLLPLEDDKKKKDREPSVAVIQSWSPSEDIKAMARYVLLNILNNLGNFPPASGARRVSSIVAEDELLESIKNKSNSNSEEFLRYFIFDDSVIFGVIDLPYEEGGPSSAVIIRDQTGKYAWQAQLVYVPTTVKEEKSKPTSQNVRNTTPYEPKPLTKPVSDFKDLFAYLEQQRRNENIIELTQKQVSIEESYLKAKNYGLDLDIMVRPPTSTVAQMYSGDSKLQMSRILLSHLGFLSPENRSRVRRLEKKDSLLQSLKNLDQIPERYCQSIGVVFVGEGNKSETEVYGNQNGTGDYQEFLTGLGWGVQTSSHLGYLGGVDPSPNLVLPYFADYCTEVIFHVSTLLPNADTRKKLISKDYVVIVWAEDDVDNYNFENSQFKNNDVQIVIHPQSSGLYRVRVISKIKERGFSFGPLLDNMAVRKESLPALVRATAMNAYKHIQQQKEANYRPFVTRRATIEEISNRFKREEPIEHFYSSLFTNTTAGQSSSQVAPVTMVVPNRTPSAPIRSVSAANINRPTSPPPQQPAPTPTKPTATKPPSGSVALPKTPSGTNSPAAPGSPAPLVHSSSTDNMNNWNSTAKTPVTRNPSGFLSRNKLTNSQETSTQKP